MAMSRSRTNSQANTPDTFKEGWMKLTSPLDGVARPVPPLARLGCTRDVNDFQNLNQIGEGTYGIVYRARDNKTGNIVALKRVRMEKERNGLPISSVREVCLLRSLSHANIINVVDMASGSTLQSVYLVMEYCAHDMAALMEQMTSPFREAEVKCLALQLLEGTYYLHRQFVVHRDLKMSNLLLTDKGILKIADFGLARSFCDPPEPMTPLVVTLWYRAPELLLGCRTYGTAVDMWAVGCILGEWWEHKTLLPGQCESHQLELMVNLLGTPNDSIWAGFSKLPNASKHRFPNQPYNSIRTRFSWLSPSGVALLNGLLTYDPAKRLTAKRAIDHEYFNEMPYATDPELLPTFPEHRNMRKGRSETRPPKRTASDAFGDVF